MNNAQHNNRVIGFNLYAIVVGMIVLSDAVLRLPLVNLIYGKEGGLRPMSEFVYRREGEGFLGQILSLYQWQPMPYLMLAAAMGVSILLIVSKHKFILSLLLCFVVLAIDFRNIGLLDGSDGVMLTTFPFFIMSYIFEVGQGKAYTYSALLNRWQPQINKVLHTISFYATIGFMIQICFIYFFTAFHKYETEMWRQGIALYYVLRINEFSFTDWNIPLSQNELFVKFSTYFTLIWEFTFPLFIWFKRTKWLVILAGIGFHIGIYILMRIDDFSWIMIGSYAVFISDKEYVSLWQKLTSPRLVFFYDDWCPNCTRFAYWVQKLNWLNRIQCLPIRDASFIEQYNGLNHAKALKAMASKPLPNGKYAYGFQSLLRIAQQIPLGWLFVPFMYALKWTNLGEKGYNELALKRQIIPIHCDDKCAL